MKKEEIIPGTKVRYWSIITATGEKYEPVDTVITSEPWILGANIACNVESIGCVLVSHLEKL